MHAHASSTYEQRLWPSKLVTPLDSSASVEHGKAGTGKTAPERECEGYLKEQNQRLEFFYRYASRQTHVTRNERKIAGPRLACTSDRVSFYN